MHMKLPPAIRLTEIAPGYPVFQIDHARCSAKVALHGAHVMSWKPAGEDEVLYLSPDAVFEEGRAIRGGIPICWPWFNAHPADSEMPSHGIARARFWELVEADENEEGVVLRFEVSEGIWNASAAIHAGEELEVVLETRNRTEIPIVVAGALHSYLAVSDIGQVRIVGLEGSDYVNPLGDSRRRSQRGPVRFGGEVEAVYDSSSSVLLVDDFSGRTLMIEKGGSPSTVVWNPWAEKSAALSDLPDDGYRSFCCIEAAIENQQAVVVMPGASHVLRTRISIEE